VPFGAVEGMPWVKHQSTSTIVEAARLTPFSLALVAEASDVMAALARVQKEMPDAQPVICGSLYLVAEFMRAQRPAPMGPRSSAMEAVFHATERGAFTAAL